MTERVVVVVEESQFSADIVAFRQRRQRHAQPIGDVTWSPGQMPAAGVSAHELHHLLHTVFGWRRPIAVLTQQSSIAGLRCWSIATREGPRIVKFDKTDSTNPASNRYILKCGSLMSFWRLPKCKSQRWSFWLSFKLVQVLRKCCQMSQQSVRRQLDYQ